MFEYVRDYYGVDTFVGQGVIVDGKPGVVIKDCGHHVGVNFDSDNPGVVSPCHPTWKIEYGKRRPIRKMTRSQARYRRYLESSDIYDSFLHFLQCEGGV